VSCPWCSSPTTFGSIPAKCLQKFMDLLVAIQRDGTLRHLKLDARATAAVARTFAEFGAAFLGPNTEVHEYEAGFQPDDDGVVKLDFELPEALRQCGKSKPSDLKVAEPKLVRDEPPSALVAIEHGRAPRFTFQAVDNRNLLRAGGVLLFNPKGFSINPDTAIAISSRVDAVYKGKHLYFKNEHTARRFLNIDQLFRAVTDDQLEQLFSQKIFAKVDLSGIKTVATVPLRRKLHAVLASGREIKPKILQAVGERVGHAIEIRKGALVVPTERAEFREFVRILADDYLESLQHEDQLYVTNSKRRVKAK
ncbi:MAG TPA: hypothetical protein VNW92_07430, partial [Polyangiaceae bacterium]|nr:hypothetical protein [Polyangiaceae bacterium]